jgi:hypothetical protein
MIKIAEYARIIRLVTACVKLSVENMVVIHKRGSLVDEAKSPL